MVVVEACASFFEVVKGAAAVYLVGCVEVVPGWPYGDGIVAGAHAGCASRSCVVVVVFAEGDAKVGEVSAEVVGFSLESLV